MNEIKTTHSTSQTEAFAARFAKSLKPGDLVLLEGNLGAGKTTFVRGLAKGLGVPQEVLVHSPTFTLINEYPGKISLIHIDLYRVEAASELSELGLEEYLEKNVIVVVEWSERINTWPESAIRIQLQRVSSRIRTLIINKPMR